MMPYHILKSLNTINLSIIMNGVRVDKFKNNKGYVRDDYRLCYASCYTRGLMELVKIFLSKIEGISSRCRVTYLLWISKNKRFHCNS